jgi:DNA-directed RNA polymerase specialized sigma24 family protein
VHGNRVLVDPGGGDLSDRGVLAEERDQADVARKRAECAELERETREVVRELYERGAKPSQLAEVLGVTRATIHNW